MTGTLILLRHGESEWNAKNLFTGWVDVGLSAKGEAEAIRGGELLVESNLLPNVVHTSPYVAKALGFFAKRCIDANIVQFEGGQSQTANVAAAQGNADRDE